MCAVLGCYAMPSRANTSPNLSRKAIFSIPEYFTRQFLDVSSSFMWRGIQVPVKIKLVIVYIHVCVLTVTHTSGSLTISGETYG